MSYQYTKNPQTGENELVIMGWEEGLGESPYNGLGDMRNVDNNTIPGEISVAMKTQSTNTPIALSGVSFTASSSILNVSVGDNFQGGKVAYILQAGDPGYIADGIQRGLVVSSIVVANSIYWHATDSGTTGATGTALGTGQTNTTAILALYGVEANAAKACDTYSNDGYSDWYLPSLDECSKIVTNRAALGFPGESFWTSTEISATNAYIMQASNVGLSSPKSFAAANINVRAMRSFTNNVATYHTFNWSGGTTIPVGTALYFTGSDLPNGVTAGVAYYVISSTSNSFTVSATFGGATLAPTDAGTGTMSFTVINIGTPIDIKSGIYPVAGVDINKPFYYLLDDNGRIWVWELSYSGGTARWIYLKNLTDETSLITTGNIIVWKGYVYWLEGVNISWNQMSPLISTAWTLWKTDLISSIHSAMVSINKDAVYFCNSEYVGSLKVALNATLDMTDAATYNYNSKALNIPANDYSTCLAELGSQLLVGGINNYIYPWDFASPSFNTPIPLSENYTTRMVTVNTTTYIFCGSKGRIYITNGANANLYWEVPDFLSETVNPYFIWTDAVFNRNQLYFGFKVTTNSGTTINKYGGLWSIDLDKGVGVGKLQNQLSYATYSGYVSALCAYRGTSYFTPPTGDGYALFIGWYSGSVGGIDKSISTPYSNGEAYIVSDMLPVGQYLTKKTFSNIEFKLATPLVTGESVAFEYRTNITEAFTPCPITQGGTVGELSGISTNNFQNVQWLQIKAILTSTATNPSYVRLQRVTIR
jgi:hypothetical protein